MLTRMSDPLREYRLRKEYSSRINRVLDFINLHLSEELTLKGLSHVASFSPYHFHRIFHAMVGEPLYGYITRLRLEKAAHRLRRNLNLPVTEIALECGFSSSSAFTRAFRLHFHEPPTVYRRRFLGPAACPGSREARYGKALSPPADRLTDLDPAQYARFREFPFQPTVEHLLGYHIAYIRLFGFKENTYNEHISCAFERLALWLKARDLFTPQSLCIGVTYDDTEITEPARCRYMACFTVPDGTSAEGEIGIEDIPAGKYAVVHIEGQWSEYGQLFGKAIEYLHGVWFPTSGYEPGEGLSYLEKYYGFKSGRLNMDLCVPAVPV